MIRNPIKLADAIFPVATMSLIIFAVVGCSTASKTEATTGDSTNTSVAAAADTKSCCGDKAEKGACCKGGECKMKKDGKSDCCKGGECAMKKGDCKCANSKDCTCKKGACKCEKCGAGKA